MFAVLADDDGLEGGVEWFADLQAAHALVADLLRLPITPPPRLRLVEITSTGVETLWTSSWEVPWQDA